MLKSAKQIMRKVTGILGAGVLLQIAGCTPDALFDPILTRVVFDVVFGAFNIPVPF